MPEYRLKAVYEHGSADNGQLDLYDASVSLQGLARALTIATHAYVAGEVRYRATTAAGTKIYLEPAARGSFIEAIRIVIDNEVVKGLGYGVAGNALYDFIKWALRSGYGAFQEPPANIKKRIEPVIGELPVALEQPLQLMHRPIYKNKRITLSLDRARGERLITFDQQSAEALAIVESGPEHDIVGNITRFNVLSSWGRLFDRDEGRTISFKLSEALSPEERQLVTWSLDEVNNDRDGTLYFDVNATRTPSGEAKRYLVTAIRQAPVAEFDVEDDDGEI